MIETLHNQKFQNLMDTLLAENPRLHEILQKAETFSDVEELIRSWVMEYMQENHLAWQIYKKEIVEREIFEKLKWSDFAAIRILDYLDHSGETFQDENLRGEEVINHPFHLIWKSFKQGAGIVTNAFLTDMVELFRQFAGSKQRLKPDREKVMEWMSRHPSGLDPEIILMRNRNKDRIIKTIIERIDKGEINDPRFNLEPGLTWDEKNDKVRQWWDDRLFHLRFAIRKPDLLNRMLDYSLSEETMNILYDAEKAGIPFFVNPYYLSLLNVDPEEKYRGTDTAIRSYILYSQQLVDEFGHIVAWEREDIVEPDKPNAAGWMLPPWHNIHRRYPEVAILIPDTIGRACGGLCASCQRMYDFQKGNLNFNLEKLRPKRTWPEKLRLLMTYFRDDSQLRDILITGGDALMSTDASLKRMLNAVYDIALEKKEANLDRKDGEKYAEMIRVRLGTRIPVYLPQRITHELVKMLRDFKERAVDIGIKQFVIQTHFETAMEVTPESREAVKRLISAGWIVTNQQVFTTDASRRGHTARLREVLNDIGVLPYYTFSVKGYQENWNNFATNARAMQEQLEEKRIGKIAPSLYDTIRDFPQDAENIISNIDQLRKQENLPFLAVDRNVLNLPAVGKSLTFRVTGITHDGRRIMAFDHDPTRNHSPMIEKMDKIIIIESKSIYDYLNQLSMSGEDIAEYDGIYGYSLGATEERVPIYDYPGYDYNVTTEITNLEIGD